MELDAPVPTASMVITQATPMMIPSMVRSERILLRAIAIRPTLAMFHRRMVEVFIGPPLPILEFLLFLRLPSGGAMVKGKAIATSESSTGASGCAFVCTICSSRQITPSRT